MTSQGRIAGRLFLAVWIAFAFFHQGGGWNQNARFATVRALVERGSFALDEHLLYTHAEQRDGRAVLVRTPVRDAVLEFQGRRYVLAWPGNPPVPVRAGAKETPIGLDLAAASGDVAFANGHFYANKAPGSALLAAPGYFVVLQLERALGLDPDAWWVLTVNAWLTTVLSVGLASALGCVALFRALLLLWPTRVRAAVAGVVTFAFGTLFFPFATMLFEQNIATACLTGGFLLLLRVGRDPGCQRPGATATLAGLLIGLAVMSSYGAIFPGALLVVWSVLQPGGPRRAAWIVLGGTGPALLLGAIHDACFGSPFATSFPFQNPLFQVPGLWVGLLGVPEPATLAALLVSPFRGLFFSSPVLVVASAGLWVTARDPSRRGVAVLCGAILAVVWIVNASVLDGWHAGWGVGPRYLIPALPFLAVGLATAFARWPRTTGALAALSILFMATFTVVDPQSPVGTSPIAERPDRARFWREPWSEYAVPIFFTGQATPILRARAGTSSPELLAFFQGPVSAHPIGVYEAWIGRVFAPPAPELIWNAFNAGEFLLPESRATPLLLVALVAPLLASAWRLARKAEAGDSGDPVSVEGSGASPA